VTMTRRGPEGKVKKCVIVTVQERNVPGFDRGNVTAAKEARGDR